MAREIYIGADGLRIAKFGFDAMTASEANLIFSSNAKQLMQIDTGTIASLNRNAVRINFSTAIALSEPPLVLCGRKLSSDFGGPIRVNPDMTGFSAAALPIWDGSYPAEGYECYWVAYLMGLPDG